MTPEEAVQKYQCPGCVLGPYPDCYKEDCMGVGCDAHVPGTMIGGLGSIFLGLPKGFHRIGNQEGMRPRIFLYGETQERQWGYDRWNVPVWMYFDGTATFVRGYQPRVNTGFIHVILEDVRSKVGCTELTTEDLEDMD